VARGGGVGSGPSQKAGRLSGPLHRWNGHNRSLVPNTGECGLEEECCAATGERRGGGGQRIEEKRRVWPGGGVLRCCRREKRRRRTEEKKEEEKKDFDWSLIRSGFFFFVATFSCFQTRSSVSGFLSLALLRKPNREAKAWRRWWWWC